MGPAELIIMSVQPFPNQCVTLRHKENRAIKCCSARLKKRREKTESKTSTRIPRPNVLQFLEPLNPLISVSDRRRRSRLVDIWIGTFGQDFSYLQYLILYSRWSKFEFGEDNFCELSGQQEMPDYTFVVMSAKKSMKLEKKVQNATLTTQQNKSERANISRKKKVFILFLSSKNPVGQSSSKLESWNNLSSQSIWHTRRFIRQSAQLVSDRSDLFVINIDW